ncbi:MAG: AAA-like domain-containing protein [Pleurocapsa sp. MO_226.B13]|nr:AAA-like domain-containing protein [Pleurocapsa sp. MO_226.B13]
MNDYYQIGGSLGVDACSYAVRDADTQLYQALLRGEFCYVFNCRQMGKSSLRVRTKNRLEQQGYICVSLDMTNIGGKNMTPLQWYKSITSELWRGLELMERVNFRLWWKEQNELSPLQKLYRFIKDIILSQIEAQKIFIFIDEIDSVIDLNFPPDDFFALIFHFYHNRAEHQDFERLGFALFGTATPSDLIVDRTSNPFDLGRAIELTGFTVTEACPLIANLQDNFTDPQIVLKEILKWTGGQPFLTQKLCHLAVKRCQHHRNCLLPGTEADWVTNLVYEEIINNWESQDEPVHFRIIRDRLLSDRKRARRLLRLGVQILSNGFIPADDSPDQKYLLLSNLVVKQNGQLIPRNLIYQKIFDLNWVMQQLTARSLPSNSSQKGL